MQNSDFFFLLERIGRERGLSPEVLLESVKEALLSAYKKKYGQLPQNLQVILDEKK
ncbi:transcription termination/antitermination protein NusA, partial [Candidatus Aerophobetes bacterium]|nr:transcription termination/antitermination protein NusA [Candidatus Aerophobetes bacterium]